MKWLKRTLRRWLLNSDDEITLDPAPLKAGTATHIETKGMVRIEINKAVNGYTVQVMSHKPQQYGPDWTGDLLVVPQGGDYMEVIKTGLAIHMVSR